MNYTEPFWQFNKRLPNCALNDYHVKFLCTRREPHMALCVLVKLVILSVRVEGLKVGRGLVEGGT